MKKTLFFPIFLLLTMVAAQAQSAVATNSVNFRTGPGTKYAIRGSIPAGAPVYINRCSGNWCSVKYGNRTGWTSRNFLSFVSGGYYNARPTLIIRTDRRYSNRNNNYWYGNKPNNHRPSINNGHRPRPPSIGNGHRPRPPSIGNSHRPKPPINHRPTTRPAPR